MRILRQYSHLHCALCLPPDESTLDLAIPWHGASVVATILGAPLSLPGTPGFPAPRLHTMSSRLQARASRGAIRPAPPRSSALEALSGPCFAHPRLEVLSAPSCAAQCRSGARAPALGTACLSRASVAARSAREAPHAVPAQPSPSAVLAPRATRHAGRCPRRPSRRTSRFHCLRLCSGALHRLLACPVQHPLCRLARSPSDEKGSGRASGLSAPMPE